MRAVLLAAGLAVLSIGLIAGAGAQGIERRTGGDGRYPGPSPFLVFAASIPVSLLAVLVFAIPLTLVGVAVDGPIGRLASVVLQALVYTGLIRLLVVDTGALSWAEMGLRQFDRRALGELATGALWAGPVIFATIVVAGVLHQVFPVTPVSPLPPTGELAGLRRSTCWRARSSPRSARSCCSAGSPRRRGLARSATVARSFAGHCSSPWSMSSRSAARRRARPSGSRSSASRRGSRSRWRSDGCSCDARASGPRSVSTRRSTRSSSFVAEVAARNGIVPS